MKMNLDEAVDFWKELTGEETLPRINYESGNRILEKLKENTKQYRQTMPGDKWIEEVHWPRYNFAERLLSEEFKLRLLESGLEINDEEDVKSLDDEKLLLAYRKTSELYLDVWENPYVNPSQWKYLREAYCDYLTQSFLGKGEPGIQQEILYEVNTRTGGLGEEERYLKDYRAAIFYLLNRKFADMFVNVQEDIAKKRDDKKKCDNRKYRNSDIFVHVPLKEIRYRINKINEELETDYGKHFLTLSREELESKSENPLYY